MATSISEKITVDEGSMDTIDNKEEEERLRGLKRRRRREEGEEDMRSHLPPGHRECQKLVEHTSCSANHTNRNDCILRQLVMYRLNRSIIPQAKEDSEKTYPDMDPESGLDKILDERLPEIHKTAREFLRDQLISIYYMEKCPLYNSLMNAAEHLHRNSHLPVPLAITEVIHFYKPELNKVSAKLILKDKVQTVPPITKETKISEDKSELSDLSESESE